MSDEDRPKKSWREIDRQRDGSTHRREERSLGRGGSRRGAEYESRKYKSELERAFSGGGLPELLAKKLDQAPGGSQLKVRQGLVKQIRNAADPKEAAELITELWEQEGELPRSEDVLIPAVEHPSEEIALAAIKLLADLVEQGLVKRQAILKTRLQGLAGIVDDPDVDQAARALLARLG